jgi:ubiquinone/menaquinone biosynthesis C-methylase UbiE
MSPRFQRRIQRYGWDKAAAHYESYWSRQIEPAQSRLLERAALHPGENVLDVACGTGLVTFRAAAKVGPSGSVLGTDISEKMVLAAREEAMRRGLGYVRFERAGAEEQAVDGERFDAALCSLGLMYFPDPLDALGRMHDALTPNGRAVAAVWGERSRCGWAEIFPIVDCRVESEVCPMFFQLGTGRNLEAAFTAAGFTEVETTRLAVSLPYESAADALGAAFAGGPVALAYSRFDESKREGAHREYLESIEPYRRGRGYEIPGEFVVTTGRKSAARC